MSVHRETSGALRVLPRGRHAAPREVVADSQRERMLVAMAEACATKGYANVAVADVIERAHVSRRSFYEQFSNKEDCFLAAYDAGVAGLLEEIAAAEEAARPSGGLLAAARAGTETYLQLLADNPAFARTFLIEVLGAGPDALARRDAVHQRFAERLMEGFEAVRGGAGAGGAVPAPAPFVFRAAVGAIHELVTQELLVGGPEALPGLLDQVLEVELRLLGGGVGGVG
ncbi:MAG TPA: helix-turn-helix domain-containing protein [Baekduia sp.]|uniref:TetR/AcrR family transcriptional regulator n=1 Tax=Baekduia sp. TaxID=2600305 RepID=UPI002D7892A0|nr:helix-turn-helix domain-containing protein [Baekduia sp.]HET6506424.1 helix-turn-helix domain-containing protein [Baekduia sp.]